MTVTTERRKLYEDIQMLCAGHDVGTALPAVIDASASLIAFAARDRDHASALVAGLLLDIERTISDNWDYVRAVRSATIGHPNTAQ